MCGWGLVGEGKIFPLSVSLTFPSVIVINVRLFLLVFLANSALWDGVEY